MGFTKNKDLNFSQDSHREKCRDAHVKMELTQQTGHCGVKTEHQIRLRTLGIRPQGMTCDVVGNQSRMS